MRTEGKMKANLIKRKEEELYYFKDGKKQQGKNPNMRGDCSRLSGDCTELSGDLDDCEITEKERKEGIDISRLLKEE